MRLRLRSGVIVGGGWRRMRDGCVVLYPLEFDLVSKHFDV